jgi:hypothetical protein
MFVVSFGNLKFVAISYLEKGSYSNGKVLLYLLLLSKRTHKMSGF